MATLNKWDIVEVWFHDLAKPHFKYCICICPKKEIFFFINSDPPFARKARDVAISVSSYEVNCLRHESYIDTTHYEHFPDDRVQTALKDDRKHKGPLAPFMRKRIVATVKGHGVLPLGIQALITEGEND
jgi:hypothetical protein